MTQCAFGGGIFNTSWQDILSGLGWGLGYFGMPHILVRFMSIEKPSMIKKSSIVAIVWVIISLFSAVMIAYLGRMVMGAVAGVISGFVIDLGWLLTGMTASTGIFEIVPGFFGSLVVAIIVAKLTSAPNEKAVAIFEQGTSKNAD